MINLKKDNPPQTPPYFGHLDELELAAIKQIYQSATDPAEAINYQELINQLASQIICQPRYYNPDNLDKKINLAQHDLTQSAEDKPFDLALQEYEEGFREPLDFRLTGYAKSGNQYSPHFQQTIDFWHHKELLRWIARENWEKFCQFMHCDTIPKNLKRCYALYQLYRHLFYNYQSTYPTVECYIDPDYEQAHQLPSLPRDYPIQPRQLHPNQISVNQTGCATIPETRFSLEKKLLDLHFSPQESENILHYFEKQWQITSEF